MKTAVVLLLTIFVLGAVSAAEPKADEAPRTPCTCEADARCECVPRFQCKKGVYLAPDDARIDFRAETRGKCPKDTETCCKVGNAVSAKAGDALTTTTPRCGISDVRGASSHSNPRNDEGPAAHGEFPWMVAVFDKVGYKCGGALLSPRVVLTATHCIDQTSSSHYVHVGDHNLETADEALAHQKIGVKTIRRYPGYQQLGLNALTILVLKEPVQFARHVSPVCFPSKDQAFHEDDCVQSTWGKNYYGNSTFSSLMKATMPLVSRRKCQKTLRTTRLNPFFLLHDSLKCAGEASGDPNANICIDNLGSPLVCPGQNVDENAEERYYLVGLTAWRIDCGYNDMPGVFINIDFFRDWIEDQLRELDQDISIYQ